VNTVRNETADPAFAMGPKTLEEGRVAGLRQQLERTFRRVPEARPQLAAIFGGVVDPSRLPFPLNRRPYLGILNPLLGIARRRTPVQRDPDLEFWRNASSLLVESRF